jgi:hypothetical protein
MFAQTESSFHDGKMTADEARFDGYMLIDEKG